MALLSISTHTADQWLSFFLWPLYQSVHIQPTSCWVFSYGPSVNQYTYSRPVAEFFLWPLYQSVHIQPTSQLVHIRRTNSCQFFSSAPSTNQFTYSRTAAVNLFLWPLYQSFDGRPMSVSLFLCSLYQPVHVQSVWCIWLSAFFYRYSTSQVTHNRPIDVSLFSIDALPICPRIAVSFLLSMLYQPGHTLSTYRCQSFSLDLLPISSRTSYLLGDLGGVVNSLDFCLASLKSLGCFCFRCVLCSQWKAVTVNLRILHCQL